VSRIVLFPFQIFREMLADQAQLSFPQAT